MAARISGVGLVTVSERRSIMNFPLLAVKKEACRGLRPLQASFFQN
jgi:hypothetical protein